MHARLAVLAAIAQEGVAAFLRGTTTRPNLPAAAIGAAVAATQHPTAANAATTTLLLAGGRGDSGDLFELFTRDPIDAYYFLIATVALFYFGQKSSYVF